jgi:orotidine-5'-phosphate decarboxylase
MTFLDQLRSAERQNGSLLCVGLDPDPGKFPIHLRGDTSRIYDFCAAIVDATADLVIAFKPQIAYFAAHRAEVQLEKLISHIRSAAPEVPIILDAKRGDIGSTAEQYAIEAFERYGADAVTLSPFMGFDSVAPYLKYHGKGAFLLCRTSNPGGDDLQSQRLAQWKAHHCCMNILHAGKGLGTSTASSVWWWAPPIRRKLNVRSLAPTVPLLIPGGCPGRRRRRHG